MSIQGVLRNDEMCPKETQCKTKLDKKKTHTTETISISKAELSSPSPMKEGGLLMTIAYCHSIEKPTKISAHKCSCPNT